MPGFKFAEFDLLCSQLCHGHLQLKWQHYTRAFSAASASTAVATMAAAPTGGISMIGAMIAGPLMHNAQKKQLIIERHMKSRGIAPMTRMKDIFGPVMMSGVFGAMTAGIGILGAEALAVDKITKIVGHTISDAVLTKGENIHAAKEHEKEVAEHDAQNSLPQVEELSCAKVPTSLAKSSTLPQAEIVCRNISTKDVTELDMAEYGNL